MKNTIQELLGNGLNHEVSIIVCTEDKDGYKLPTESVDSMITLVTECFVDMFGGATITRAQGAWKGTTGYGTEDNTIITANFEESLYIENTIVMVRGIAKHVKNNLNQDAVSLKLDGVLYFI